MGRKVRVRLSDGNKGDNISIYNLYQHKRLAYLKSTEYKYNISCTFADVKNDFCRVNSENYIEQKYPFSSKRYSPIKIPKNAKCEFSQKKGYIQVKYRWTSRKYHYEARWHTKTPNAPVDGESWVVTRTIPGKGYGANIIKKIKQVKVGSKWIDYSIWIAAIEARRNGVATNDQIKILDKGHFRKKRR